MRAGRVLGERLLRIGVRLAVFAVAVQTVALGDTGMQTGYESVGRTIGFELFEKHEVENIARESARRAITKLAARPAPSAPRTSPPVAAIGWSTPWSYCWPGCI